MNNNWWNDRTVPGRTPPRGLVASGPAVLLAAILLFAGTAAHATMSIGASPVTVEVNVVPGKTYTSTVEVFSEAPRVPLGTVTATRVKATVLDWELDRTGTPTFFPAGARPNSCAAWVEIDPSEFDLQPGGSQSVRYSIHIPAGAHGTFRSLLMFELSAPPNKVRQSGMAITSRIGTALYVTAGAVHREVRMTGMQADPSAVQVTVENTGDTHARISGTLQLKDGQGQVVREYTLPPVVVLPAPANVRDVRFSFPEPPAPGEYQVVALLDYGADVILGGQAALKIEGSPANTAAPGEKSPPPASSASR